MYLKKIQLTAEEQISSYSPTRDLHVSLPRNKQSCILHGLSLTYSELPLSQSWI